MHRTSRFARLAAHGAAYALLDLATIVDVAGQPTDKSGRATDWQTPREGWELDAFTPQDRETIVDQVTDFLTSNHRDFLWYVMDGEDPFARAHQFGVDFVLTRNGHGAGFWDRGLGEVGDRLTENSKPYGSMTAFFSEGDSEVTLLES